MYRVNVGGDFNRPSLNKGFCYIFILRAMNRYRILHKMPCGYRFLDNNMI